MMGFQRRRVRPQGRKRGCHSSLCPSCSCVWANATLSVVGTQSKESREKTKPKLMGGKRVEAEERAEGDVHNGMAAFCIH